MKNNKLLIVLLSALLCGAAQGKEKILKTPERDQLATQTVCVGGYLFAVIKFRAVYGDGGGSVSIAQIFKGNNTPIKCTS